MHFFQELAGIQGSSSCAEFRTIETAVDAGEFYIACLSFSFVFHLQQRA